MDEKQIIFAQEKLTSWGLLDPEVEIEGGSNAYQKIISSADAKWGSQSRSALLKFCELFDFENEDDGLLDEYSLGFLKEKGKPCPVRKEGSDKLAYALAKWYEKYDDRFWFARGSDVVNHTGIEGMSKNLTPNADRPNKWNDLIVLWYVDFTGTAKVIKTYRGTTEPGAPYTYNPMNPKGAARIFIGKDSNGAMFKSWYVGLHGSRSRHKALVQGWKDNSKILVCRDANKDFSRTGDNIYSGNFAINLHGGGGNDVGRCSAGCQVVDCYGDQRERMEILVSDRRYKANSGYRFIYGVVPGDRLSELMKKVW